MNNSHLYLLLFHNISEYSRLNLQFLNHPKMLPKLAFGYYSPSDQTLCEDSGSETDVVVEKRRISSPMRKGRAVNECGSKKNIASIIAALAVGLCTGITGAGLLFYVNAGRTCLPLQNAYCTYPSHRHSVDSSDLHMATFSSSSAGHSCQIHFRPVQRHSGPPFRISRFPQPDP